jgi:hypothetical protein
MFDPLLRFNEPTTPLTFPESYPDGTLADPVGTVQDLLIAESCLVNAMRGHNLDTDTVLRCTALLMQSREARQAIYQTPQWAACFTS